jgi:predicted ArsR family transcriptional regulator
MSAMYLISKPAQVRALASPVRQDIVDVVAQIGPVSSPEIANALGRPPDGLYFHLRLLTKVGLLIAGERVNGGGRAVFTYDVPGRPMRLSYDLGDRGTAAAISEVTASMMRSATRRFKQAAFDPSVRTTGPARELWAGRTRGWLTKKGLEEVNQTINRLIDVVSAKAEPEGGCSYELSFVLSPAQSD